MHDGRDGQVQPGGAELLRLRAAIGDAPLLEGADHLRQRVALRRRADRRGRAGDDLLAIGAAVRTRAEPAASDAAERVAPVAPMHDGG